MAERNQQQTMKNLKRNKPSSDSPEYGFRNKKAPAPASWAWSSYAFSLIDEFLEEEKSKETVLFPNRYLQASWWGTNCNLVFQFAIIVVKIIYYGGEKDPLEHVMEDIKKLCCIDILGRSDMPDDNKIYTTIVTSALQISNDKEYDAAKDGEVVKVQPNPKKGIISAFIDYAVQKVAKIILYPPSDNEKPPTPNPMLEGDFAPIREETCPTSDLIIKGEIPANLNGMMIRNGPDPLFDAEAKYAWMDGDSMLHAIRFENGKATYVSRYVQTSRLKQEKVFNKATFLKYGDLEGKFGIWMSCVQLLRAKLEILDLSYGWLNADTGVVYHNGMLMALQDFDKPYVINVSQNGDLETCGINDYKKRLTHSFLPHPKKDPVTGELFIVGVSYTRPYATYNYVSKEGVMSNPVPLNTVSGPSYMHDLGITQNYVIFMDLPYSYDPEHMVKEDDKVYMFNTGKKPRFGILPRYATSEEKIKWFECDDSFFIFHNGNSWEEEDGTIVMISCLMGPDTKHPSYAAMTPPVSQQTNSGRVFAYSSSSSSSSGGGGSIRGSGVPKKTKLFFSPPHLFNGGSRRRSTATNRPAFTSVRLYSGPRLQGNQTFLGSNDERDDHDEPLEEHIEFALPTLHKFTFNMETGKACHEELSKTLCDYPKINESYIGRKMQYVYTSEFNKDAKITSLVKTDLQSKHELQLKLGENKFGSEVAFVSRQLNSPLAEFGSEVAFVSRQLNSPLAEDDGYLTTFVHDEETGVSYAYVIDAQKMAVNVMIELPKRVPYGFHATFVTEDEIQAQKCLT